MTTRQKQKAVLGVLALLGAIISSPFLMGAVRAFDGRYVHRTAYETTRAIDWVRDSAWRADVTEKLRYNSCRWDKPRKECLR